MMTNIIILIMIQSLYIIFYILKKKLYNKLLRNTYKFYERLI